MMEENVLQILQHPVNFSYEMYKTYMITVKLQQKFLKKLAE